MKKGDKRVERAPTVGIETRFSSTNQPERRGTRGPSILNEIGELCGIEFGVRMNKKDRINVLSWIIERPRSELVRLRDSESSPIFVKALAGKLIDDLNQNKAEGIAYILERIDGRPVQQKLNIELAIDPDDPDVPVWEFVTIEPDQQTDDESDQAEIIDDDDESEFEK